MLDTKINDSEIARKLLEQGILNDPTYSIHDLFRIRDLCLGLAYFGLEDKDLLNETLQAIKERIEE